MQKYLKSLTKYFAIQESLVLEFVLPKIIEQ